MLQTLIVVGAEASCRRLACELATMALPPRCLGWITFGPPADPAGPVLGTVDEIDALLSEHCPDLALVGCDPYERSGLDIRAALDRAGVTARFVPTITDVLAGCGSPNGRAIDLERLVPRRGPAVDLNTVADAYTGRTVVITGAGGSIGSELTRCVADLNPERLVLLEKSENALFEIDRQLEERSTVRRLARLHDVVDRCATEALLRSVRPDVVLHAAANKHVPLSEAHPAHTLDTNLFGTTSILDAAAQASADRFVLISTDKAVNPVSVMGATKRLAELAVLDASRRTAMGCSIVRFGNVAGSSGSVLEIWSRQVAGGGPISVTDREMTRYFMTCREAAELVLQAGAFVAPGDDGGRVFVLDMGDPIRIVELARRFVRAHGLRLHEAQDPAPPGSIALRITGIRPGERMHEALSREDDRLRRTPHPGINMWTSSPPPGRYMEVAIESLRPGRRPAEADELRSLIRHLASGDVRTAAAV